MNLGPTRTIPPFEQFFPEERHFDKKQAAFFKELAAHLDRGKYLDVAGNISYVFVYLYRVIEQATTPLVNPIRWPSPPLKRGADLSAFARLSEHLTYIGEMYAHEAKIKDYCSLWASECLLGQGRFRDYLDRTEPPVAIGTSTDSSNLRLNVQKWARRRPDPIDVLLMSGRNRHSRLIEANEPLYREAVAEVLDEYARPHGGWFSLFDAWGSGDARYAHSLFTGSPVSVGYPRPIACFYSARQLDVVRGLAREAETRMRRALGVPGVGEGWVAETALFVRIRDEFPQTTVIQHGRPDWLGAQHFDVWLPDWKIAVEYQGEQHFRPVAFFGGEAAYHSTVERDRRKAQLAKRAGVALLLVKDAADASEVTERISLLRSAEIARAYGESPGTSVASVP